MHQQAQLRTDLDDGDADHERVSTAAVWLAVVLFVGALAVMAMGSSVV